MKVRQGARAVQTRSRRDQLLHEAKLRFDAADLIEQAIYYEELPDTDELRAGVAKLRERAHEFTVEAR